MMKWLLAFRLLPPALAWSSCLAIATAAGPLGAQPPARTQAPGEKTPPVPVEHWHPQRLPEKPTVAPSFTVPILPLGFTTPGALYFGQRYSLASLDFLDENRLLFTFRVPGLIHRDHQPAEADPADDEHRIRAVVIALPAGNVTAEAMWTQHDRGRYLWMLRDGHFLVRDRNAIRLGDASLELKPYLEFPGRVMWVELDPAQQYLVTDSFEPKAEPKAGEVPRPATASATVTTHDADPPGKPAASQSGMVVRILERSSGRVMLVSRVRSAVHLPIKSDGYLEAIRGRGAEWQLTLNSFTGGETTLGEVESTCSPAYDFISERVMLATTCARGGEHRLVAVATNGRRLWEEPAGEEPVWPLISIAADGSRLVRESLVVNHSVNAMAPVGPDDVKGQLVEVFDAATGNVALAASATPVLDAGGNAAISPSGRRVAVVNDGVIQVFDLPVPPAIPDLASQARR